jgi:uncharacterized protein
MKKIIESNLFKFTVGFAFIALVYFGLVTTVENSLNNLLSTSTQKRLIKPIVHILIAFIVIFAYKLYFKYIEKKEFTEFEFTGASKNIVKGFLFTLVLALFIIAILFFAGNLIVRNGEGWILIPISFSIALISSVGEEILFRGLLFRLTEEKLGSIIAIIFSSLLFGFAHLVNDESTFFSSLAIGLEAGLLLSAVYILTRKLWLNISIHFTWNFFNGIMGFHYLDNKGDNGFFNTELSGNIFLTGGITGIESSMIIVIIGLVLGIYFIKIAYRDNKIIKPYWEKK